MLVPLVVLTFQDGFTGFFFRSSEPTSRIEIAKKGGEMDTYHCTGSDEDGLPPGCGTNVGNVDYVLLGSIHKLVIGLAFGYPSAKHGK